MKRQFVKETKTDDENLQAGTDFAKQNLGAAEIATAYARRVENQARELCIDTDNRYKDFANFLSCAPLQLFNLRADDKGLVSFGLRDLHNYTQVFIVGVDEQSVV